MNEINKVKNNKCHASAPVKHYLERCSLLNIETHWSVEMILGILHLHT